MKIQPFEIRPASLSDLTALSQVESRSFSTPWSDASISSFINGGSFRTCYVASTFESQSEVVGYVAIQYIFDEAEISNIVVCPEMRGNGIGRALLDKAISFSSKQGIDKIFLEVRESNVVARSLYESIGFESVGRRTGYYSIPEEDAILYSLAVKGKKNSGIN